MKNLYRLFEQNFPKDNRSPFILDENNTQFSYQWLIDTSARWSQYLASQGLQPGDRVAVSLEKTPAMLALYLGVLRGGFVYLPMNTAYTEQEYGYFIADAAPAIVIVNQSRQPLFEAITAGTSCYCLAVGQGAEALDSIVASQPKVDDVFEADGEQLAAIVYTSGTTGQPKGAMISHKNLAANAIALHTMWGFSNHDVLLHCLPIFHVHGLFVACHAVLMAGAKMIMLEKFAAKAVINTLPNATVMMGVPTYYTRLMAEPQFDKACCAAMRLFISGSAPLLSKVHDAFTERTGQRILERYGMSETAILTSNPLDAERRAGTVGFALPGVTLRVVDEQCLPVSANQVGSIQVKGSNVFSGYWNKPEKTAAEFTDDGYFITGDQGSIAIDGYLRIVGRSKDMIITGGLNVYPKEVEQVIDRIAGVRESAVFGLSDADFGERVVAAIVAEQSLDTQQIICHCREQLSAYKIPKQCYFVAELPRNTMGKVQKNRLREQYRQ